MIKLIENTLPSLQNAGSFVGVKISSNYLAYGTKYPFCTFWAGYSDNTPTAIINKYENTIFILCDKGADCSELKEFCDMIGYSNIQSNVTTLKHMGFENINEYTVLCYENNSATNSIITNNSVNLKEVYDTLFFEQSDILVKPDFDGWYADLSHRIRHEVALALNEKNAALIFSHINDVSAIISGISVLPNARKSGVATKLLSKAISIVSRRKIFACTDLKTSVFYLKNGFAKTEKLGIYSKSKGR